MEKHTQENALLAQIALATGGRLYIVKKGEERAADVTPTQGDVLVRDDRHTGNPSFQIVESHRIRSSARMREILACIIDFDARHPTDPAWQRGMDSLLREWKLHNLAYRLHVCRGSARHVDLDNRDEGKGYARFFLVAAARAWERIAARLFGGTDA